MRTRLALVIVLAVPAAAMAGPISELCGEQVCADLERGLERPGLSYDDRTDEATTDVEVADFYFSPRILEVSDGATVRFTNVARGGGHRHSVASADWGGSEPVLPVPGTTFGGGQAFRSELLQPGTGFVLQIDIATMDPAGYIALPGGDVLVAYFCYVHGASQMNGQLLVRR